LKRDGHMHHDINADEIYRRFFNMSGMGGAPQGRTFRTYMSNGMGGMGNMNGMDDDDEDSDGFTNMFGHIQPTKEVVRDLTCTIADVYLGTEKKLKITRKVYKQNQVVTETEILKIKIEPGYKDGTKIKFHDKGDKYISGHGQVRYDTLVFVIKVTNSQHYHRDDDDLIYDQDLTLVEAQLGCKKQVMLPSNIVNTDISSTDGNVVEITIPPLCWSNEEVILDNYGFVNRKTNKRGRLIVQFQIQLQP